MGTESYTGAVFYEDALAKTVGRISVKAPTSAGCTTTISTIIGTAALETAMGGDTITRQFRRRVQCNPEVSLL